MTDQVKDETTTLQPKKRIVIDSHGHAYELTGKLGEGGQGVVCKTTNQNVLVKICTHNDERLREEWINHIRWLMRQPLENLTIARPVAIIEKPRLGYSRFNPTSILLVDQNATAFVLTPLDFLVEEKMVTLLTVWKWQSLLGSYGREIFRVPSPITQYLSQLAQFEVIGSQVALIAPVHQSVVRKIETLFMQLQVSKELCNEFMSKIDGLEL